MEWASCSVSERFVVHGEGKGSRSDSGWWPQGGERLIHFRLLHTKRTGRPPEGRSRIWMTEGPWPVARTPQLLRPTRLAVVSMEMNSSPPSSMLARTMKPSIPNNAFAPLTTVIHVPCPPVSLVW